MRKKIPLITIAIMMLLCTAPYAKAQNEALNKDIITTLQSKSLEVVKNYYVNLTEIFEGYSNNSEDVDAFQAHCLTFFDNNKTQVYNDLIIGGSRYMEINRYLSSVSTVFGKYPGKINMQGKTTVSDIFYHKKNKHYTLKITYKINISGKNNDNEYISKNNLLVAYLKIIKNGNNFSTPKIYWIMKESEADDANLIKVEIAKENLLDNVTLNQKNLIINKLQEAYHYCEEKRYNQAKQIFQEIKAIDTKNKIAISGNNYCWAIKHSINNICSDNDKASDKLNDAKIYLNELISLDSLNKWATQKKIIANTTQAISDYKKAHYNYKNAQNYNKNKKYDRAINSYNKALDILDNHTLKNYVCIDQFIIEIKKEKNKIEEINNSLSQKIFESVNIGPDAGITNNWVKIKSETELPKYRYHPMISLGAKLNFENEDSWFLFSSGFNFSYTGQSSFHEFENWVNYSTTPYDTSSVKYLYDNIRFFSFSIPLLVGIKLPKKYSQPYFAFGINVNNNFGYKYKNYFTDFSDINNEAINKWTYDMAIRFGLRSFYDAVSIDITYYHGTNNLFNTDYQLFEEPYTLLPYSEKTSTKHSIVLSIAYLLNHKSL